MLRTLVLLAACALVACSSPPRAEPDALGGTGGDDVLATALLDEQVAVAAFLVTRSVVWGGPAAPTRLIGLPARRVFVCAYAEEPRSVCASGVGADLDAAVREAATGLVERVSTANPAEVRLKLDVATSAIPARFDRDVLEPEPREVGLWNVWYAAGGESAWVLPSEVLEAGLYAKKDDRRGLHRRSTVRALQARNPALEIEGDFDFRKLTTTSWVEEPDGTGAFRLYRLHDVDPPDVTADALLARIVLAADYLLSSVSPEGRIRYRYRVVTDDENDSYNLLRHAGTTYAMFQVYDRTGFEPYRTAGEAAIRYLFSKSRRETRTGPWGGGDTMFVVEGKEVKLGGAGLALVALVQHMEATDDRETWKEEARAYARFLVSQQKRDGEFVSHASLDSDDEPSDRDSIYYPGEAIYGLIRLYAVDPNPLWLATAVRGADWLINVRDAGKEGAALNNDHWLMLGLSHLHHATRDVRYRDHSVRLARAVEVQYRTNEALAGAHPDYLGGYYDPPRSTPAAIRAEGLGAVLDTCHTAALDCVWVESLLHATVRHMLWSQYDARTAFWMENRAKAFGGISGGLLDPSIRNDFVQHGMSALLATERQLRRGEDARLPGAPGPREIYARLPAEEFARLHAPSLAARGPTAWEVARSIPPEAPTSAPPTQIRSPAPPDPAPPAP